MLLDCARFPDFVAAVEVRERDLSSKRLDIALYRCQLSVDGVGELYWTMTGSWVDAKINSHRVSKFSYTNMLSLLNDCVDCFHGHSRDWQRV